MIKMIFNLGSKKCENNDTSTFQLTRLHNLSFISIVDTPKNYVSNIDSEIRHEKSTYIFSKVIVNIILLLNMFNL